MMSSCHEVMKELAYTAVAFEMGRTAKDDNTVTIERNCENRQV
jgi:hypothetical protein